MASVESVLPRFISISLATSGTDDLRQDIYLYARCVQLVGPMYGLVSMGRRDDEGVTSPFAKFEVEESKGGGDQLLVHIKSCYNNNYLRRVSDSEDWIAASGQTREEDRSKPSCTLFRPIRVQDGSTGTLTYRFRLLGNNGQELEISQGPHPSDRNTSCLHTLGQGLLGTRFEVVDLETLAVLPRFVAIQGDNERYLRMNRALTHLQDAVQFSGTATNDDLQNVQFEVFTRRNGAVLFRNSSLGRAHYLVATTGFFTASSSATGIENSLGLLYPLNLGIDGDGRHVVVLKHVATGMYCRRQSGTITDGLTATSNMVVSECQMLVGPALQEREVYNVQFMEAKIYDIVPVKTVSKVVVNGSRVSSQEAELSFSYRQREWEAWESSHEWHVGFNYTSTVSARLPVLKFIRGEATMSLDASVEGQHTWGKEEETTTEVASRFKVKVPPGTRSRVVMVVNTAKIDVPFSYTQRDTLLNWDTSVVRREDGHFESEGTHIDFEVFEQPLEAYN